MERKYDNLAGYKHHLTNQYLEYLKKDLMKVCQKEHADEGTLPSRPYIKTAPGKIATLNTLKATRDKLIKQQQSIRTRYYSARDKEKELYTIKRNVDIMLEDRSHERNRDRSVSHER